MRNKHALTEQSDDTRQRNATKDMHRRAGWHNGAQIGREHARLHRQTMTQLVSVYDDVSLTASAGGLATKETDD